MSSQQTPFGVLVTGNEPTPFWSDSTGKNPSFEIIQKLDGLYLTSPPALPTTSGPTTSVRQTEPPNITNHAGRPVLITAFNTPIPNVYARVPPFMKQVHSYSWDLIIHCGRGLDSEDCLWIESQSAFSGLVELPEGELASFI